MQSKKTGPFAGVPIVAFDFPHFESAQEEAEWWQTHRQEVEEFLASAQKAGALKKLSEVQPNIETQQTTIRLLKEDVARAKVHAQRKGVRYQTYLKMLIHEALQREEKAS